MHINKLRVHPMYYIIT